MSKTELQTVPQASGMELLAEMARKTNDPQAAVAIAQQIAELQIKMEELRQNRDRFDWEKQDREARVAFAVAFQRFKEDAPKILKTKHVVITPRDTTKTGANYWHVELDKACDLLIPALLKVNITHRWVTEDLPSGLIRCTCYLKHCLGYEEKGSSLAGAADTSGGKNPIQGVGSSTSYLERYTFLATCGIVASNADNDGNAPEQIKPEDLLDESTVMDFIAKIEESSSVEELKGNYQQAMKAGASDPSALKAFDAAKKKVWKEKKFHA